MREPLRSINKTNIKQVMEELNRDLGMLGIRYGVSIKAKSCRYSATNARFAVELAVLGGSNDGHVFMTKDALRFKARASYHGLKADYLGRTFLYNMKVGRIWKDVRMTIIGLRDKKAFGRLPKYPVLCTCSEDGKTYKLAVWSVKSALENTTNV